MLQKREPRRPRRPAAFSTGLSDTPSALSRRRFLRQSGVTAAGLSAISAMDLSLVRPAAATPAGAASTIERKKTVCPFCAVGCTIWAELENGVWIGQEPAFEKSDQHGHALRQGRSHT